LLFQNKLLLNPLLFAFSLSFYHSWENTPSLSFLETTAFLETTDYHRGIQLDDRISAYQ